MNCFSGWVKGVSTGGHWLCICCNVTVEQAACLCAAYGNACQHNLHLDPPALSIQPDGVSPGVTLAG